MKNAGYTALLSLLVLFSVLAVYAFCRPAADPREKAPESGAEAKVEQLLARVAELEKRVAELERRLLPISGFEPDERGILRDAMGRRIGIWGVDGVNFVPERPGPEVRRSVR